MPKINIVEKLILFKTPKELLLFILFEKVIDGLKGVDKIILINELSERSGLSLVLSEIEILDFLSCHQYGDDEGLMGSPFIEVFLSEETNMIWMRKNFRIYLVNTFYNYHKEIYGY